MSKSGYEIRLEILQLAASQLQDDFYSKRSVYDQLTNSYINSISHLEAAKIKSVLAQLQECAPSPPSPEQISERAKALYKFVDLT